MANILITNVCNADCDFCFAREKAQNPQHFISMDELEQRLRFIQSSGYTQVRLMGGEPTIHPHFQEIVSIIRSTGLDLILFSNGFIPEKNLTYLEEIPAEKLALLINVNAQGKGKNLDLQRLRVLKQLNIKVTLGFTILNPDFDLSPYFRWVNEYRLQRKIRLGLAHPIYGGGNQFLSPKLYKKAARSILINAKTAQKENISLEFDCGFVRCMFTGEEWQRFEELGVDAESHCAPNLDIGMDGKVLHCFSISQIATSMEKISTARAALKELNEKRKRLRQGGIYPECSDCKEFIDGSCCGGCLSLTLRRFHNLTPEKLQSI